MALRFWKHNNVLIEYVLIWKSIVVVLFRFKPFRDFCLKLDSFCIMYKFWQSGYCVYICSKN